ncbi:hypothetical protein ACRQ84_20245 (plasmid) [Enterobacter ludwigii]
MTKKLLQYTILAMAIVAVNPANAISAAHRAALERSGCDMQNEATWCDIHKTKAQNEAHRPAADGSKNETGRNDMASFLRSRVVAQPKASAFAALVERGFMRENDGDYFKMTDNSALHVLMTFNADGTVASATLK